MSETSAPAPLPAASFVVPPITTRVASPLAPDAPSPAPTEKERELGGPDGRDPTRFLDWERSGRCIDF